MDDSSFCQQKPYPYTAEYYTFCLGTKVPRHSAGIVRRRLGWCMQYAHAQPASSQLAISRYLLPSFHPFIMAFTRQQSYTDIANTSTSVRDCVRQRNETPKQREERLRANLDNEKRLNSENKPDLRHIEEKDKEKRLNNARKCVNKKRLNSTD